MRRDVSAEFATSTGRTAKRQERHRGNANAAPIGWENVKPHECEPDIHDLGGAAARAKIVERKTKQQQECGEKHVARTGDNRPQQRRMERDQQRRDSGGDRPQNPPCGTPKSSAANSAKTSAATSAGAGVPAGAEAKQRAWSTGTAWTDRPQRSARSAPRRRPRCWRQPRDACIVGDQTVAYRDRRKRKQCHEHQRGDRRSGESVRRTRATRQSWCCSPRSWRRLGTGETAAPHAVTGHAGSFPNRTDHATAARAPDRRRSRSSPSSRTA